MFNIIPQPVSILINQDRKGFTLHAGTTISPYPFAEEFASFVRKTLNKKVYLHEDTGEERSIILKIDESIEHDEGYTIKCENRRVFINARTETGLFYGLQTLKQMLLQTDGKLPYVELTDYPRFSYRGFMLDCGRYFYTVDEIKRIVDLMALHKLNVLHWHLTEDQGWRIEIKKYPLLTEKGSKRSHTNFNNKPHSGYYTQDQVKEIVAYCHDRKIKVIPEFDVPGHNVASIACYPELSCLDRKLEVATHWGVKHDILCAGKESTYKFVYDVLDELIELFPDKIIHIGGDEAPKTRWCECDKCKEKLNELGLVNMDQLQGYLANEAAAYLKKKGKKAICWNEAIKGGNVEKDNITVALWRDKTKASIEWANGGNPLIAECFTPYYVDYPYGMHPLKSVYMFEPRKIHGLTSLGGASVIGVESPIWTEYVTSFEKMTYLCFPRWLAVAETGWNNVNKKGYAKFIKTAEFFCDILKGMGITPAPKEYW